MTTVAMRSEIFDVDRSPVAKGSTSFQRALEGARDRIEQGGDGLRLRIGLVERRGEQRSPNRARVHVCAVGQTMQLCGMFVVKQSVEAVRVGHRLPTRMYTPRVPLHLRGRAQ